MIRVDAGVYDRNPGTCPGIAGRPSVAAANLQVRRCHVGICRFLRIHNTGLIARLHHNFFHTRQALDGLDLAIRHVGGNEIRRQGQVPDNVQLFFCRTFNGGSHIGLATAQSGAIRHG